MKQKKGLLQKLGLMPKYSEISLFLTAFTFLLTILPTVQSVNSILEISTNLANLIFVVIPFFLGLIFSIYYAFSKSPTPRLAKFFMLFFVLATNFIAALFALGTIIHIGSSVVVMIFPIINVINSILILSFFRAGVVNADCVADKNATYKELTVGSICVLAIVFISQYILKNMLTITFSICLSYSSIVNNYVTKILDRK